MFKLIFDKDELDLLYRMVDLTLKYKGVEALRAAVEIHNLLERAEMVPQETEDTSKVKEDD